MNELLLTKVKIPKLRPETVFRPHLTGLLEKGLNRKLTLISAPPGSGKTNLLVGWRATSPGSTFPLAWVSLDESDNDPVRFWCYVITALRTLAPSLGEESLAALANPQPAPIEAILTSLINSMLEQLDADFVLVLDDYHFIQLPQIHAGVSYLLEHLPSSMHLVIASRSDPVELPLSRLRVRNELVEIRAEHLRFSREDASAFFSKVLDAPLTPSQIEMLDERTEGWAAGLQLAALSLQGHKDPTAFIRSFTGSHGLVLDYLGDEVLNQQSEPVQEFLLHTAFLGQLNEGLARAVSGQPDSREMLEKLDRANLFLGALDNNREWYRYHPLFAGFLVDILKRTAPQKLPELHRRAAAWYATNGFEAEAVKHSLAAKDYSKTVELLSELVLPLVHQGQSVTVMGWFDALPAEVLNQNPRLNTLFATALMIANRFDEMDAPLERAENYYRQNGDIEGLVFPLGLRSLLSSIRGEIETTKTLAALILEQRPQDGLTQTLANVTLGSAFLLEGEITRAESWLKQRTHPWVELQIRNMLAEVNFLRGNLKEAERQSQDLLELKTKNTWQEGFARVRLSRIYYEWDRLEEARYWLDQAISRSHDQQQSAYLPEAYLALARLEWAEKKKDLAFQAINRARDAAQRLKNKLLEAKAGAWQIYFKVLNKEYTAAWEWVKEQKLELVLPGNLNFQQERHYLALVQLFLSGGQVKVAVNEALLRLEWLAQFARAQGRVTSLIEILALKALALDMAGRRAEALSALTKSVQLAAPGNLIRFYLNQGDQIRQLLKALRLKSGGADYAGFLESLLAAFDNLDLEPRPGINAQVKELAKKREIPLPDSAATLSAGSSSDRKSAFILIEPLSERELEVLRLIGEGISNKAIADKLYLSLATVKTHINHLYAKLEVENRVQALDRARTLNLI